MLCSSSLRVVLKPPVSVDLTIQYLFQRELLLPSAWHRKRNVTTSGRNLYSRVKISRRITASREVAMLVSCAADKVVSVVRRLNLRSARNNVSWRLWYIVIFMSCHQRSTYFTATDRRPTGCPARTSWLTSVRLVRPTSRELAASFCRQFDSVRRR